MQELLDVARVQMGQALMLDLRQTDLVNLAQRLVGELKAAGKPVSMSSTYDQLAGWWDEARLSRVLSNLLDNAFNYSPPGSVVDILIDGRRENDGEVAVLQVCVTAAVASQPKTCRASSSVFTEARMLAS